MKIYNIPTDAVGLWLPIADPLLERALSFNGGEMELDDVHRELREGGMWLLVGCTEDGPQAAFVCAVFDYHRQRIMRVVLAAGEPMEDWIEPLIEKLEEGCATIGAENIEFFGRPGFTRALKAYCSEQYTVMVRKVRDVQGRQADPDQYEQPVGARGGPDRGRGSPSCGTVGKPPPAVHRA